MRNISTGKIKQFYSADQLTKESIRNDVLFERYADLQAELSDLEEKLNNFIQTDLYVNAAGLNYWLSKNH